MERRKIQRSVLKGSVKVEGSDAGTLGDVSVGGILFTSEVHYEVGALVEIEVQADADAGKPPLKATLKVLRCEGDAPPYQVAGEFQSLSLP